MQQKIKIALINGTKILKHDDLFKRCNSEINSFFLKKKEAIIKKITYKGLGFKILIGKNRTKLYFKIGFSHFPEIIIPNFIKSFKIKKTKIIFESTNKNKIGCFLNLVERIRPLNSYKNKGFSIKTIKKFKPIKKK